MNYFVTAAALRLASANALTQSAYWSLSRLKSGPRKVWHDQAVWLLDNLPPQPGRLLELGTGWVHAYSLYQILLRDDEVNCFDVLDRRRFKAFLATIGVVIEQIKAMPLDPAILARAEKRAAMIANCTSFEDVYGKLNVKFQVSEDGVPHYPENTFDAITSVDVLEHVGADIFRTAAAHWYKITKPGGRFLAQVGIDDHLSHYDGFRQLKRYLKYSRRTWDLLLNNEVQYINRLTASEIVGALKEVGFKMDHVETDVCEITRAEVHPDYQSQSDEDIRAVRLIVRAHK